MEDVTMTIKLGILLIYTLMGLAVIEQETVEESSNMELILMILLWPLHVTYKELKHLWNKYNSNAK